MVFRGEYKAFGLIAIILIFCVAESALAQRGGRRGGRSPFAQSSGLNLLSQEGIQQELELVEEQVASIRELQDQQRNAMREMFMSLRDGMDDLDDNQRRDLMTDLQTKMKAMNKEFDAKTVEILLPHQTTRLRQLVMQSQNRRSGGASTGAFSEEMIEQLGITDVQLEKLKAKAEEVGKSVTEKIAAIRAQAEEEVLSVLDENQRAKYKELIGETYDFGGDRDRRGGWGRGRRGLGGPGGGRRPNADSGDRPGVD